MLASGGLDEHEHSKTPIGHGGLHRRSRCGSRLWRRGGHTDILHFFFDLVVERLERRFERSRDEAGLPHEVAAERIRVLDRRIDMQLRLLRRRRTFASDVHERCVEHSRERRAMHGSS